MEPTSPTHTWQLGGDTEVEEQELEPKQEQELEDLKRFTLQELKKFCSICGIKQGKSKKACCLALEEGNWWQGLLRWKLERSEIEKASKENREQRL